MTGSQKSKAEQLDELHSNKARVVHEITGTSVDWHLQKLVFLADSTDMTMDITLFIPTGIITGKLISRKKYFKTFADSYKQAFEASFPDVEMGSIAESMTARGVMGDDISEGETFSTCSQFIHLEQATPLTSDGDLMFAGGMLWRGKINSVSGFSLIAIKPEV